MVTGFCRLGCYLVTLPTSLVKRAFVLLTFLRQTYGYSSPDFSTRHSTGRTSRHQYDQVFMLAFTQGQESCCLHRRDGEPV